MCLNRQAKDQNVFATDARVFFSKGPVALVLAFKPEWKMFTEFKYLTSVRL